MARPASTMHPPHGVIAPLSGHVCAQTRVILSVSYSKEKLGANFNQQCSENGT
jgi:hypothetical protein